MALQRSRAAIVDIQAELDALLERLQDADGQIDKDAPDRLSKAMHSAETAFSAIMGAPKKNS
jgi:hypothetical protein